METYRLEYVLLVSMNWIFRNMRRPIGIVAGLLITLSMPGLVPAALVEVAAEKNISFCEKVAKFFGERLAPNADLLKTVEWKAVELKGQGTKTRHCSSLDKAIFDLNNDGRVDLVIKTTFCMKGGPSDSFYMFPSDSTVLEQANWQDLSPLLATSDKFERTGGVYPLTQLPSGEAGVSRTPLAGVFTVQPFMLDGSAYVSLTDGRAEWTVIAKFLGGERFEDQCYLQKARR
jgi:hypothetical protein